MTQDETRQLGIEFERRLQTLDPTLMLNKPDTDTIYSFLNEGCNTLLRTMIVSQDSLQPETRSDIRLQDAVRMLIRHSKLKVVEYDEKEKSDIESFKKYGDYYCTIAQLPIDFWSYVRSSSIVERIYNQETDQNKLQLVSNKIIRQSDVPSILEKPYNEWQILRSPLVVLEETSTESYIKVLHDKYTDIVGVDLTYYKQPNKFGINPIGGTITACDLPYEMFDLIVNSAVSLYIQYRSPQSKQTQPKKEKEVNDDRS